MEVFENVKETNFEILHNKNIPHWLLKIII